jgi:purine-cytosine permease-like protein
MVFATVLGLIFVPLFFVVIRSFFARRRKAAPASLTAPVTASQGEE